MTKARLIVTVTIEYEITPANYDDCETDEQRLQVDLNGLKDEPYLLMESDNAKWDYKAELIKS